LGFAADGLGTAASLGSGFLGLAVFLMAVTLGCLDASVNGWSWEIGFGGGLAEALTSRLPRTTWFPKSIRSAERPAH
jgi:hypothetical protein